MLDKIKKALAYLRDFEPARLAAIKTAAFGLLATLGLTVSPALDARAGAVVVAATGILTLIQSVLTRSTVWSPASVDQLTAAAASGQDSFLSTPTDIPQPSPYAPYDDAADATPEGF